MKTLTGMMTLAALVAGLAVASAQSYPPRGYVDPYPDGPARIQEERGSYVVPSEAYESRSTTGVAPKDVSRGQPNEQGQHEERDLLGRTGGNTQHPAR